MYELPPIPGLPPVPELALVPTPPVTFISPPVAVPPVVALPPLPVQKEPKLVFPAVVGVAPDVPFVPAPIVTVSVAPRAEARISFLK
jgi:hypothetical protein